MGSFDFWYVVKATRDWLVKPKYVKLHILGSTGMYGYLSPMPCVTEIEHRSTPPATGPAFLIHFTVINLRK